MFLYNKINIFYFIFFSIPKEKKCLLFKIKKIRKVGKKAPTLQFSLSSFQLIFSFYQAIYLLSSLFLILPKSKCNYRRSSLLKRKKIHLSRGAVHIFCFLFKAASEAYGSSWARGQIRAAAAGLSHSYSNVRSDPCPRPIPQITTMPDL